MSDKSRLIHPERPQIAATEADIAEAAAEPLGFDYAVNLVAEVSVISNTVTVYVAKRFGQAGVNFGHQCVPLVAPAYNQLAAWYGNLTLPPVQFILAPLSINHDGTGGAYHWSCAGAALYADCCIGNHNPTLSTALFVAELVEVFEAVQNKGCNCGYSNGEALSRFIPEVMFPGALAGYDTASIWLNEGRANWIDQTNPSDLVFPPIGCGTLFLHWLLRYGIPKHGGKPGDMNPGMIIYGSAPTLAETYGRVTNRLASQAWSDFIPAVNFQWPATQPYNLGTDDPWPS